MTCLNRNYLSYLAGLSLALGALGCGDGADDKTEKKEDKDEDAKGEAGDEAAEADEPVEEEPEEVVEPSLTASNYDGAPLLPSEFAQAFNPWLDKTVVIAAHPAFFSSEGELVGDVALNLDPSTRDKTAQCSMKTDAPGSFSKTQVVVLEGTFDKVWFGKTVLLKDCEKVEIRDDMPSRIENLDPARYDGTSPIPLDQYLEAMAWKEKEVVFHASFNGATTSTTDYGTSYRIDLYDEGPDIYTKHVSAYVDSGVPEENFGTSKVWKMKCQVTGEISFDRPEVKHCEFLEQVK